MMRWMSRRSSTPSTARFPGQEIPGAMNGVTGQEAREPAVRTTNRWRLVGGVAIVISAAICLQLPLCAAQRDRFSFNQLMMEPKDPLSSKDLAELETIERDYNRDIEYLSIRHHRTVPKIIHFIWIGPRPFPKESIDNLKSWKKYHPHWQFYFWTDSADRPLPISGMERKLIQEYDFGPFTPLFALTDHWAEKADLIRYMVLYNEGGIYSDHDVEAFRSFSPLAKSYDFVVGLEWYNYHPGMDSCISACNAIIISRPHHPVLRETIDRIVGSWDEIERRFPGKENGIQRVIARTFDGFALSAKHCRNRPGYRDIILPNSYFYPFPAFSKATMETLRKAGYVYAVHKYGGTWKEWNSAE